MSDEKNFDAKKFADDLRDHVHQRIDDKMDDFQERLKQRRRRGPIVIGIGLTGRRGSCESNAPWGLIWGVLLALIGVVILLDNMGIAAASHFYRLWPMLLIVPGVLNAITPRGRLFGILLIFFGTALQLHEFGIARFSWGVIWGLVWIAVGVIVLWSSLEARKQPPADTGEPNSDVRARLNEVAIFGGVERRITTQDFQGGSINAVFGGVEIDMSEASMLKDEAILEVNAIFGGVELRVPDSWQVVSRGAAILGGFVDKTRIRRTDDPANPTRKMLILTGAAVFGGVEIKN
jgi:predicted membrane protein